VIDATERLGSGVAGDGVLPETVLNVREDGSRIFGNDLEKGKWGFKQFPLIYLYSMMSLELSRYIKIGAASKLLGVTPQTLRRWEREGQVSPDRVSEGGTRYYEINHLLGLRELETDLTVAYARVSSHDQKEDLKRQGETLERYCAKKGWRYELIQDLGSGMNYRFFDKKARHPRFKTKGGKRQLLYRRGSYPSERQTDTNPETGLGSNARGAEISRQSGFGDGLSNRRSMVRQRSCGARGSAGALRKPSGHRCGLGRQPSGDPLEWGDVRRAEAAAPRTEKTTTALATTFQQTERLEQPA